MEDLDKIMIFPREKYHEEMKMTCAKSYWKKNEWVLPLFIDFEKIFCLIIYTKIYFSNLEEILCYILDCAMSIFNVWVRMLKPQDFFRSLPHFQNLELVLAVKLAMIVYMSAYGIA